MNESEPTTGVSLLWPSGVEKSHDTGKISQQTLRDLGIDKIAAFISQDHRQVTGVTEILANLCQDPQVIHYRQEIMADLLLYPDLVQGLKAMLPLIADLGAYSAYQTRHIGQMSALVWRLGELELYIRCIETLYQVLVENTESFQAEGLVQLRLWIKSLAADPDFQALVEELPNLMAQVRQMSSVTIGVNLDAQLRPEAGTLLSINNYAFKGESLLQRLLGHPPKDEFHGITPLYQRGGQMNRSLLQDLLKDLDYILDETTDALALALGRYTRIKTSYFKPLAFELVFYLGATRLINQVQARGLSLCRPEIAPQTERVACLTGLYDLNLALRLCEKTAEADLSQILVTNDISFQDEGRIFILTGPNQGGKTTYTQAIGLSQALFQAGLYIPGTQARLSPVDGIFTHFPAEENPSLEAGRFGEEAKRLNNIFQHITRYSLVLLNESLTSTSEGEALYLAQDIVRGFRLLGLRVVFATHLHNLAECVEEINTDTAGDSRLISLVAGMVGLDGASEASGAKRTYKIQPGHPLGISYARDIAAQFGISLEKILQTLEKRQVM